MTDQPAEPIVDLLEAEWAALAALCEQLDDHEWDLPTDLPGWTVRDNVTHIVGTERMMRGEPAPEVDVSGFDHVRNPVGSMNELWIEARRGTPGPEVLAELRTVADERIAELRALPPERFDELGWTPAGEAPYREFLRIRVFDSWMHEQDIRRATGRPGNLSGPAAEHALDRCALAMGFVVGKRAGAPDGSSVALELVDADGPRRTVAVVVDGRAAVVDPDLLPPTPSCTIRLDVEAFCCLGGGRWDPGDVLGTDRVAITGDTALGERVVRSLNFMI